MIETCAEKGFDAVEYDNLDSWTRFDGTPRARDVPFGRAAAIAYAESLADRAHALGLAVAQKNTPQLTRRQARGRIGFDFAIAEQCGALSRVRRLPRASTAIACSTSSTAAGASARRAAPPGAASRSCSATAP